MLIVTLIVAISNGTSGLSRARVQLDTATCMADDSAQTDDICTYLIDASRTCAGTKAAASRSEDAAKITVMMAPSIVWTRIREYEIESLEDRIRFVLSPMMSHAERGRPSFKTSTITPI